LEIYEKFDTLRCSVAKSNIEIDAVPLLQILTTKYSKIKQAYELLCAK